MHVRRVVDLSVPLDDATPVWPGDPPVRLTPHATVARDGYNLLAVAMSSQSGTHCDAPRHVLPGATPVDALDLRLCAGPAVLLDVRGRDPITLTGADLDHTGPGIIVVLHTGWSGPGDPPPLTPDACRALLDRGVRTIGLDAPTVDASPYPCHHMVAEAGGVIVENLTNLAAVDFPDPFMSVLPLRLTGADGAPVRAVALELVP